LAVFVGAELAPNVPLPNVLLPLCGVLELPPNVKSGFADDAAGLTFEEKLNPPLVACCDEAEPNVNKDEFGVLVSLAFVVVNIVDAVVAPPKAGVVLLPKVEVLDDPKGDEVVLLDSVSNVGREPDAAGELNTGNFVSVALKIGGLLSVLLPNVGILFSGMANPGSLLSVVGNDDDLSVPNAIVVFDSLLNSDVELETIGKSGVTGVSFAALVVGVVSVVLFPPNDTLVDNVADDVGTWPKDGIAAS